MAEHLKGIGEEPLEGIGGWLWLVALGIVASPLRIIFLIFPLYSEIFKDGSWEILTSSGTEAYHPMWAPIILAEMTINAALVLTWIFVGFLFFLKKAVFPKFYIGILLFTSYSSLSMRWRLKLFSLMILFSILIRLKSWFERLSLVLYGYPTFLFRSEYKLLL